MYIYNVAEEGVMVQLLHGILFFSQPPFGLTLSVTLLGEELFFGSRTSTTSFYWPWRDGRGGNVRSDGLLSDFLSHFCPRQPLCRVMSKLMNVLFLLLQLLLFLPLFDLRESTPRERERESHHHIGLSLSISRPTPTRSERPRIFFSTPKRKEAQLRGGPR